MTTLVLVRHGLTHMTGPLLAGYQGATDRDALRENVSLELCVLAAGALRRLEPCAQARAKSLLERAVDLVAAKARLS